MCFQYSLSGVEKWLQVHDEIVVYSIFSSSMRKIVLEYENVYKRITFQDSIVKAMHIIGGGLGFSNIHVKTKHIIGGGLGSISNIHLKIAVFIDTP